MTTTIEKQVLKKLLIENGLVILDDIDKQVEFELEIHEVIKKLERTARINKGVNNADKILNNSGLKFPIYHG